MGHTVGCDRCASGGHRSHGTSGPREGKCPASVERHRSVNRDRQIAYRATAAGLLTDTRRGARRRQT